MCLCHRVGEGGSQGSGLWRTLCAKLVEGAHVPSACSAAWRPCASAQWCGSRPTASWAIGAARSRPPFPPLSAGRDGGGGSGGRLAGVVRQRRRRADGGAFVRALQRFALCLGAWSGVCCGAEVDEVQCRTWLARSSSRMRFERLCRNGRNYMGSLFSDSGFGIGVDFGGRQQVCPSSASMLTGIGVHSAGSCGSPRFPHG